MQFVITSIREHQLRSISVPTATAGAEVLETCLKDGFRVVLILDGALQRVTPAEVWRLAAIETMTQMLD